MAQSRRVIAIRMVPHPPYVTNLAANVLAGKMSSDENATNVSEGTVVSRTAGVVKS